MSTLNACEAWCEKSETAPNIDDVMVLKDRALIASKNSGETKLLGFDGAKK